MRTFGFLSWRIKDAALIVGLIIELRGTLCADSWPFSPQTVKEQLCFCLPSLCSPPFSVTPAPLLPQP